MKILQNKKLKIQDMVIISMLSAIGLVLYKLKVPIYGELSVNLSDIAALIGGAMVSPVAAAFVTFFRCVLKVLVFGTSSFGIGEAVDFVLGSVLTVGFICMYGFLREKNANNTALKRLNISNSAVFAAAVLVSEVIMLIVSLVANAMVLPLFFGLTGTELNSASVFAWLGFAMLTTTLRVVLNCGVWAMVSPFTGIFKKILSENR
jgi:riboflavin transporter FmnP